MKVYIGPYTNWIGPYQIADKIPLVSDDTRFKIGEWLSKTWVNDLCHWFYDKQDQKIKVRIDKYDTWSMDHTLAHIILPMLKQLRDTKHGSQYIDDEDLPPHMQHDGDNWVHYKWDWVLNEMIFAFESKIDNSWEEQFYHGEPKYIYTPVNPKEEFAETPDFINDDDMESDWMQLKQINPDYWVDYEGMKVYNDRIQNGFRLFGKYYQGLWD